MFFDLAGCPLGWSEFVSAHGRYVVGVPSGGALGSTVGTPLDDQEDRPVGQHTHVVVDPGHAHYARTLAQPAGPNPVGDVAYTGGNTSNISNETGHAKTGITLQDSGDVPGTNAPYVQLLACVKN